MARETGRDIKIKEMLKCGRGHEVGKGTERGGRKHGGERSPSEKWEGRNMKEASRK